ncbi:MAG: glycosyltransferase family 9 protein [Acidisphaera sp.]|nr:glycosyltransferase family 9 protein [Acidisphaera sp.]
MLAIVKADHVGDLVLASPAINFLAGEQDEVVLFVSPGTEPMARVMFPLLDVRTIVFPHLAKSRRSDVPSYLHEQVTELAAFDRVVFLRHDHVMNRPRMRGLVRSPIFTFSDARVHETVAQVHGLAPFFGTYDRDAYWPGTLRPWPEHPRHIGLCLGSGFPANQWPMLRWVQLARALREQGVELSVLRTPREADRVDLLRRTLGGEEVDEIPCASLSDMLDRVAALDLVIATDGGGGHLCSLAAPVLSVAGSVPFRQFAPFGRHHRVVSMDLPCSPCTNFHPTMLNGCVTYECIYGIEIAPVLAAITVPNNHAGQSEALPGRARLFFGMSHA